MSDELPEDHAWNGAHASEAAIVMIADAQLHLVPDTVLAHVDTCAECNHAIAEAAMLSVHTGEALAAMASDAKVVRLAIPWRALLAAAAVALVGALPSLVDAPAELGTTAVSVVRTAPHVAKGLGQLLHADTGSLWVTLVPAVLLLIVGFALTRALPTPVSHKETGRVPR